MDHDKVDFLTQTLMHLLENACKESDGSFDAVDDVVEVHGRFSLNVLASSLLDALADYKEL